MRAPLAELIAADLRHRIQPKRRRDYYFADIPSPCLLKTLIKGEEDAAEWQSRRRLLQPLPPHAARPCCTNPVRVQLSCAGQRLVGWARSTRLAVGETVILLTLPPHAYWKHLLTGEEDAAE